MFVKISATLERNEFDVDDYGKSCLIIKELNQNYIDTWDKPDADAIRKWMSR